MRKTMLKMIRWPLLGVVWTSILVYGVAAQALARVDESLGDKPKSPPMSGPPTPRPVLRVIK